MKQKLLLLSACAGLFSNVSAQSTALDTAPPEDPNPSTPNFRDSDSDGWDDLWVHIFVEGPVDRDFLKDIKPYPKGDFDGDGISNFDEMLAFRNPYQKDLPAKKLSLVDVEARRALAVKAALDADRETVSRFQDLQRSRGLFQDGSGKSKNKGEKQNSSTTGVVVAKMLSSPGDPEIIFHERLSSGRFLLSWEGDDSQLYNILGSDDLVKWERCALQVPLLNGLGVFSEVNHAPKRFYQIHAAATTLPSDPSGGDGISTFGATITPVTTASSGGVSSFSVQPNLPSGITPFGVVLVIDGERHTQCSANLTSPGTYVGDIRHGSLTDGSHTAYAIVNAYSETTAVFVQPGPQGGIFRSPAVPFLPEGALFDFQVSETQIAPNDPHLPAETEISFSVEDDPQGATSMKIFDENGTLIREWTYGIDYPIQASEIWDGTDTGGSQVPAGSYHVELHVGDGGVTSVTINAGPRTREILCLMENQANLNKPVVQAEYYEEWMSQLASTGHTDPAQAWGPWRPLTSLGVIVDEVTGRDPEVFGLGDLKTWKTHQWQSGSVMNANIPDPVAAFAAGQNPFNSYDMGIFLGHGVSSGGGTVNVDGNAAFLPPQHYFPLTQDRQTGKTFWVESAKIPPYGEGGKLKNMFLMTCSSLKDNGPHDMFTANRQNNSLPFGAGLHTLCGYTTQIRLHGGMGGLLSEGLAKPDAQAPFRDGTVVNTWGWVWQESENKDEEKIARALYWPECELNTIAGVAHENITQPVAHASQMELKFTDFSN